jgi:hypothetical protein
MPTAECPVCGSTNLRRSQTRFWEQPLKWLTRRRAYRCRSCHWRGWIVYGGLSQSSVIPDKRPEPDLSTLDRRPRV